MTRCRRCRFGAGSPALDDAIRVGVARSDRWAGILRGEQLIGWGLLGARRTGAGWARGIVVGAVDGMFALAIVGLEVLLH